MCFFSAFNYNSLSPEIKEDFDKALAKELVPFMDEIEKDDVLNSLSVQKFVTSSSVNNVDVVTNLYSIISGGIQVGSGNQKLYLNILNAFAETWDRIIKK